MKAIIDLPPDLLQIVAAEGIALPDLVTRLLRRHFGLTNPKPEPEIDALDWRDELL
jgi:hypothetical protein